MQDSPEQDSPTSSSANPTNGDEPCSPTTGPESPSTTTSETSDEGNCLTPWDPQRQRIFDGTKQHPALQGGKSGDRGFNVPNVLMAFAQNQRDELRIMDGYAASLTQPGTKMTNYIFSAEASPAKTSPSPETAQDSQANDPDCSTSSPESSTLFDPDGYSSRTYPDCSPRTAVGTSESCLERWPTSGTAWDGGLSTAVSSECRNAGGVCSSSQPSLTEILEPPQNVPAKYSLSARAAQGILRRAEKRGRTLPPHLEEALATVAGTTATPSTGGGTHPSRNMIPSPPSSRTEETDIYDAQAGRLVVSAALTSGGGQQRYGDGSEETFVIAAPLTSGGHPNSNMPGRRKEDDVNLAVTHALTSEGADASEDGTGRGTPLTAFYDTGGSQAGFWGSDEISPTLKVGSGVGASSGMGIAIPSVGVRRLTPTECERLQGLPDGWTAHGPDSRRYSALGDAVTASVSEWIGRRLVKHGC